MSTIASWFADLSQARQAVLDLLTAGTPRQDIGVVVGVAPAEQERFDDRVNRDAVGGRHAHDFVETLMGARRLALQDIGPVAVAGPLVDALAGDGVETAAGDLRSALFAMGLPETDLQTAAEMLSRGGALLVVRSDDARDSIVRGVFHHYADPAWQEHDETGGPVPARDLPPDHVERPVSTSIGALTGGMVPGGWGAAGEIFEGRDEST